MSVSPSHRPRMSRARAEELRIDPSVAIEMAAYEVTRGHGYTPDGVGITDPRDGMPIIYNAARANRPHDNRPTSRSTAEDSPPCIVCAGETTPILDIADLSDGFTFVNFNLFPMVVPAGPPGGAAPHAPLRTHSATGIHLLQWTSSYHDQDWHTLSPVDRFVVMERLASVERRLRDIYPHVTIIKNYGRLVGGSLVHGHQQIAATDVEPRRIRSHAEFQERTGAPVSTVIAEEADRGNLVLRRYPTGALSVSPWMRRPYEMVYTVDDSEPSYLFELSHPQLRDMATAMGTAIGAVHRLFPKIGRETAYNVVVHSGPGAGIYVAFLPYTQETGGFEHAGLYVCQSTPALCHTVLTSAILPE